MPDLPIPTPPTASPIADLSYRNYDGPLHTRMVRWWIVALAALRLVRRKPGFWIVVALAAFPYLIQGFVLYLQMQTTRAMQFGGFNAAPVGQRFATVFYTALDGQSLMLFVVTLMVGAGAIAADNRANALLVYLSKPITKLDYLLGKWMGVFLTVFAVAFAPALLFYLFCLTSYLSEGFLKDEPWLIVRIVLACITPAAVHASLICGFSAWSKTPRMAGAVYAAAYFVSSIVTTIIWGIRYHGDVSRNTLVQHLSIGGVIQGVVQNIFGLTLNVTRFHRRHMQIKHFAIPPPNFTVMLALALAFVIVGLLATRARIRAVEVVRG